MTDRTSPVSEPHASSVGVVSTCYYTDPQPLPLECGEQLSEVTVAYETYGELNAEASNAILICHALSGDAHVAGYGQAQNPENPKDKPGWWDDMVGPGKAMDTDRYFVICSNVLGGCKGTTGPASINPATGEPYGLDFPQITIADMVKLQKRLIEHLGIGRLLCVIGGSMGGMQVLEWTTRYPDAVCGAIPIATTSCLSAQSLAFDAVGRHAIRSDPHFNDGRYFDTEAQPASGLAIARMLGHITYLSEESMRMKFGRTYREPTKPKYTFESVFNIETYLDHQGEKFVDRFDADSYLYITRALDYFDMASAHGDLVTAMGKTKARFLVISFRSDWLFPPSQSIQIVRALAHAGKTVSYINIDSPYGHDAFLLEPVLQTRLIRGFLNRLERERDGRLPADPLETAAYTDEPVRNDLKWIDEQLPANSSVLDMGCGSGRFLGHLLSKGSPKVQGVDVDQEKVVRCVERGVDVVQLDLDQKQAIFPEKEYDYVLLSRTLQTVRHPAKLLKEVLQLGKYAIVSFPNFGYWRNRYQVFWLGKMPVSRNLPFTWSDTPNLHHLTLRDFERWADEQRIRIINRVALDYSSRHALRLLPNLLATDAIYVLAE